ncbi:hypothetical protein HRbin23_00635 [bacterium HR23]|nr:hypothetical protein HRbin23_00635 [bacterium HR23]
MPRQVVFDTIAIDYGRVEVSPEGGVRLVVHYRVASSTAPDYAQWKDRDVSALLTPEEQQTIRAMAGRIHQALVQEELA